MEREKTLALLVSVTILGSQNGVIWKNIFFRFRCVKLKSDHLRKHDFNWRFVVERRWGANSAFGVGDLNFTSHFREIHVDKVSLCIIPPNVRCMIPVTATGDGNCLFNSASLAICQKETLALELRLRACFELAKNRQFYRNHPVLRRLEDRVCWRHKCNNWSQM